MYWSNICACLWGNVVASLCFIPYLYSSQIVKTASFFICSCIMHWFSSFSVNSYSAKWQFLKMLSFNIFAIFSSFRTKGRLTKLQQITPKMANSCDCDCLGAYSTSISNKARKNFWSKGNQILFCSLRNQASTERVKKRLYCRSIDGWISNNLVNQTKWPLTFLSSSSVPTSRLKQPLGTTFKANCRPDQKSTPCSLARYAKNQVVTVERR